MGPMKLPHRSIRAPKHDFYPVKATSRSALRRRGRRVVVGALAAAFIGSTYYYIAPSEMGAPETLVAEAELPALQPAAGGQDIAAADALVETPAVFTPPAPAPKNYPLAIDLTVRNGDTLLSLLTDVGASPTDAHNAIASLRPVYNPRRLDIGQNIAITLDKPKTPEETPVISEISMDISATTSLKMTRKNDKGFEVEKIKVPVETSLSRAGGVITSSLYETGLKNGIPGSMLEKIIKQYSYDVDFQRDIRPGDSIEVLFERIQTKDTGVTVGSGKLLYAQLKLGKRALKIYQFTDAQGNSGYYNEKGESVKKTLLRTPIDGARITSSFGMRKHPILGYSKMHRGLDFGARTGTPIYAAGDGVVKYVGPKGSYGNYVQLDHSHGYATAYAHMSRFAKGMSRGKRVKQGQVIGYVGTTGRSTGAHLHYEILVNNTQVNPAKTKFKGSWPLSGKALAAFKATKQRLEAQYAALGQDAIKLAQAPAEPQDVAVQH